METTDIVHYAVTKSGVASTFNPNEIPEEYEAAGFYFLVHDVLPKINCDRNVDITVTARRYTPDRHGRITLRCPPKDFVIIGDSDYDSSELLGHLPDELDRLLGGNRSTNWPTDFTGDYVNLYIWGADKVLVWAPPELRTGSIGGSITQYNIDFPPMRVDDVYDGATRTPMKYKHRTDFESGEWFNCPDVYAVEEYEDKVVILFHNSIGEKTVILPVPLCVFKSVGDTGACSGTVSAPAKFKPYLIDSLAACLAGFYGVSTKADMIHDAEVDYKQLGRVAPDRGNPTDTVNAIRTVIRGGYR